MALHSFIEHLKYRWKAKGRHGTHSPFVYELVEQVLQNKEVIDKAYIVSYPTLALKYENLVSRIASHYKYRDILREPYTSGAEGSADMLLLDTATAGEWESMADKYLPALRNDGAVIAIDIHKSILQTMAWNKLCNDPRVRMSIDLYGVGMLLFREEFKVKQHFVLMY